MFKFLKDYFSFYFKKWTLDRKLRKANNAMSDLERAFKKCQKQEICSSGNREILS